MDTDKTVIKQNLQAITQSYEVFTLRTFFPNFLFLDFANQTITNTFINKMESTKTSDGLQALMASVWNCTQPMASSLSSNNKIANFSSKGIYPYIFTGVGSSPSVVGNFVSIFQSLALPNVTRIDLLGDKTMNAPAEYKDNLKQFLQGEYFNILAFIRSQLTNSQSAAFATPVSQVMTTTYTNSILSYIESNVYTFVSSNNTSIDTYIKSLYDGAYKNASGNRNFTDSHFNLFFVTFLPYFYFLYILSLLPSANLSATNHGVRDGIVRRWTVLAFYKFFMYFFYSIYKVSALYDPNSTTTAQIRQILDINMSSLFDQDTNNAMSTKVLDDLNAETRANMDKFASLQGNNRKITMNRSNVTNILTIKQQADAELKRAVIVKWVWFTLLLIYLVLIPLVYFVPLFKENVEYFLIYSLVWAIILSIIGMVAVAKNF